MSATHPSEHASPHRRRVQLPALVFALAGGMVAWALALTSTYALGNYACRRPAGSVALQGSVHPWLLLGHLAAFAVTGVAFAVGWRIWRATRGEKPGGVSHAVEIGAGRSRFLALWSMVFNAVIGVTQLTHVLALIVSPACASS